MFEIEKCGQKIKYLMHLLYIEVLSRSLENGVNFTLKLTDVCLKGIRIFFICQSSQDISQGPIK